MKQLLTSLCLATAALAQTSIQGTISGTIRDATGSVVPAVRVKVQSSQTNFEMLSVSNGLGAYALPGLRPVPIGWSLKLCGWYWPIAA